MSGKVKLWDAQYTTLLAEAPNVHEIATWWMEWAPVDGKPVLAAADIQGSLNLWEMVYRDVAHRRRPHYRPDTIGDADDLNRMHEANALAELILARSATPPLAIGLLGGWGEGKTHFLNLIQQCITEIAQREAGDLSTKARQVKFNAWHYAEADLWASLVSEIFRQVSAVPDVDDENEVRRAQGQQLRLAAELLDRRHLSTRLAAARERLNDLKSRRKQQNEEEIKAAIGRIDPMLSGYLSTLLGVTRGVGPWLRIRAFYIRQLVSGKLSWLWTVCAIVAVGTAAILINITYVKTLLAGASLVGAAGLLTSIVSTVRNSAKAAAAARETMQKTIEKQKNYVDTGVQVAEAEVAALEQQIQMLTPAGVLARVVADRVSEAKYRKNLSLMTDIREDFEYMAKLLSSAERSDPADPHTADSQRASDMCLLGAEFPAVDRIIIYIDDLDRCPPSQVVQVLEAVHLLLALPLFVVLVAVDPQWVTQSVAAHYDKSLQSDRAADQPPAGDVAKVVHPLPRREAMAARFLEKIFQIVLQLPPMTPSGYTQLLRRLTPPDASDFRFAIKGSDQFEDLLTSVPDHARSIPAPERISSRVSDWNEVIELPDARVVERVDPFALSAREYALLCSLGPPLIKTPRATKRLINSYGLYRAIYRSPTSPEPHDSVESFELALILLASLVGAPSAGADLLLKLNQLPRSLAHDGSWSRLLVQLEADHLSPTSPRVPSTADDDEWLQLLSTLSSVTERARADGRPLPEHLSTWALPSQHVTRFSFTTARSDYTHRA